jgi:hypothetical protein
MKLILLILLAAAAPTAFGAACCGGGGPLSFITLQQLEDVQIGMATSVRDVFGWYNPYGELEETERNQTYTVTLGAGKRLTPDLALTATVPLVYQANGAGRSATSRASLGDTLVGAQYTVMRALFQDDWQPTVTLNAGAKLPTGAVERFGLNRYLPGTGNGQWEPYLGVQLQKSYRAWIFSLTGNYSLRLPRDGYSVGDRIDAIESVTYLFDRRFSLGLGSDQSWLTRAEIAGRYVPDSAGRAIDVFLTPTYFLTQVFSISATASATLPIPGWGVNHQAARAFTLTTQYGFF